MLFEPDWGASGACGGFEFVLCSRRYVCTSEQVKFEARKHRQRHAPEGSGAPAGTEYHWLIGEGADADGRHSIGSCLCLADLRALSSTPGASLFS